MRVQTSQMAKTDAVAVGDMLLWDSWEHIKKNFPLSRRHLDSLNPIINQEDPNNTTCLLKLSAITQLFNKSMTSDGRSDTMEAALYLAVNTPLVKRLFLCFAHDNKLVAFEACKTFLAVVTSNVLEGPTCQEWINGLFEKLAESLSLLQNISLSCSNLIVYGLETLRLLLKHWRVNVTENGETKSLAFEGLLVAKCVQCHFLQLMDAVLKVHSVVKPPNEQHCLPALCDIIGTFLALHRETLLFTICYCEDDRRTVPTMPSADSLKCVREICLAQIPRWVCLLDHVGYPSRVKRQVLEIVSCSLPPDQLCSVSVTSPLLAAVLRQCLSEIVSSQFSKLAVQQLTVPLSCDSLFCSPLVVDAHSPEDDPLCVQMFVFVLMKLAVGFLNVIQTEGVVGEDTWRHLNDCILQPLSLPAVEQLHLTEIIFSLFGFQDDLLIDALWLHMEGYQRLKWLHSIAGIQKEILDVALDHIPNSHCLFSRLLTYVELDHSVILDFLISSETQFLNYFTQYLKLVIQDWIGFQSTHSEAVAECTNIQIGTAIGLAGSDHINCDIDSVMSVLIRLRLAVERLQSQGLFPYNAAPLVALLEQVEECYENDGIQSC